MSNGEVQETRLPGVGTRYTFELASGGRLVAIIHNDGRREIYSFEDSDADDPNSVLELRDPEAREFGAVVAGAYMRPQVVQELELTLGDLEIDWIEVPSTSPLAGHSIATCQFRRQTGVTVIAILREGEESIPAPEPHETFKAGDTLVVVGRPADIPRFRKHLFEGPETEIAWDARP